MLALLASTLLLSTELATILKYQSINATIRITNMPCKSVLQLPPGITDPTQMRQALFSSGEQEISGCATVVRGNDNQLLIWAKWEDGDETLLPAKEFKPTRNML